MKKTIAFFRPGLPLQLDGGDVKYAYEAEHLLEILVRQFPDMNFVVFSDVVRDMSADSRVWHMASENLFFMSSDKLKNLKQFSVMLDGCVFMPSPNKNLPTEEDTYPEPYDTKVQRFEDLVRMLLRRRKPVVQISTDPRWHWEQIEGLENIITFGQSEYEIETAAGIKEIRYSEVEHLSTSLWPKPQNDFRRHIEPMVVVSNTSPIERYFEIRDYILNQYSDVPVYGKVLSGKEHRLLKGRLPYDKAWNELSKAKVTFISPIKKGWGTSKYLECLYRGVLPILSPSYDSYGILYHLPEAIRAKDPKDFKEKADFWIANDSLREEFIMYLQSIYFDDYFQKGEFIARRLREIL